MNRREAILGTLAAVVGAGLPKAHHPIWIDEDSPKLKWRPGAYTHQKTELNFRRYIPVTRRWEYIQVFGPTLYS